MLQTEEYRVIEKVQQGNTNAFSWLVKKYQDVVFSIAFKIVRNREDAEELAQEAFIKAFRSINSFQGKSKFSTWLYTITYNTCITYTRKKRYPTVSIDNIQAGNEYDGDDSGEYPQEYNSQCLEIALKQLSVDDYMLVILYYYEDQSVDEICQVTGLSESNVKVKLHRARKKLHSMMDELMEKGIFT